MERIVFDQDSDGQWWYFNRNGVRQRAKLRQCKTCSKDFVTYPIGDAEICSAECRRASCKRCGAVFKSTSANHKFCSDKCKRGTAVCEGCQVHFVPSKKSARRFCCKACFYDWTCPVGTVSPHDGGYTITKVPPGTPGTRVSGKFRRHWMSSHRYVMQVKLGRTLLKTERVHHINGKRDDNRPENLELWKSAHPCGVRAKDYHCAGCRCFD